MFCEKCGAKIEQNMNNCPNCGAAVSGISPSINTAAANSAPAIPQENKPKKSKAKFVIIGIIVVVIAVIAALLMSPTTKAVIALHRGNYSEAMNICNEYGVDTSDSKLISYELERAESSLEKEGEAFKTFSGDFEAYKQAYEDYSDKISDIEQFGNEEVNSKIEKFYSDNGLTDLFKNINTCKTADDFTNNSQWDQAVAYYKMIDEDSPIYTYASERLQTAVDGYKEEYGKQITEKLADGNAYEAAKIANTCLYIVTKDEENGESFDQKYELRKYVSSKLTEGATTLINNYLMADDRNEAQYVLDDIDDYLIEEDYSALKSKIDKGQITVASSESSSEASGEGATNTTGTEVTISKLTPYTYSGNAGLDTYDMGGKAYKDLVNFYMVDKGDVSAAYYNLNGEYSTYSGTYGFKDGTKTDGIAALRIYGDNKLLQQYTVSAANLPVDFSVNVSGVSQLRVEAELVGAETHWYNLGTGNVVFK